MIAYRDQLSASPLAYTERADADERALSEIFTRLRVRTGHDFTNYKRATLLRRIERRLAVRELLHLSDYARLLSEQPEEADALLRELLISVTNFFRDRNVWERLEETILPQVLARKRAGGPVRVWVAGCATGEEAYSMAMLLTEAAATTDTRARDPDLRDPTSTKRRSPELATVSIPKRRPPTCRRSGCGGIS
jgi:two-component system CheB/CheR fusion protein